MILIMRKEKKMTRSLKRVRRSLLNILVLSVSGDQERDPEQVMFTSWRMSTRPSRKSGDKEVKEEEKAEAKVNGEKKE